MILVPALNLYHCATAEKVPTLSSNKIHGHLDRTWAVWLQQNQELFFHSQVIIAVRGYRKVGDPSKMGRFFLPSFLPDLTPF